MKAELETLLEELAGKPATASQTYPATAGEIDAAVLEQDAIALQFDSRVESVLPIANAAGLLVAVRVVLAQKWICAHSLDAGPPIEVFPGEEHTCVRLAFGGAAPGLCDCEPIQISRWKLEQLAEERKET